MLSSNCRIVELPLLEFEQDRDERGHRREFLQTAVRNVPWPTVINTDLKQKRHIDGDKSGCCERAGASPVQHLVQVQQDLK